MILVDNINVLREESPATWDTLRKYQEVENRVLFTVEDTKRGDKTLVLTKDDKKAYLHSKYNPLKEAEMIMGSYENINEDSLIIFYGTGLGYHIQFILEKYPNIKYYIYEPIPELMYHCLSHINLKKLKVRHLLGVDIGSNNDSSLSQLVDLNRDNLIIIELPSHKQNFPDEYKAFNEMFLGLVKGKRDSISIDYLFQRRWIVNSMINFKEVLSTPNILMTKKGSFKDKPAILVAAGPSLNEEIENLRYIKEHGLAYIFTVGSAIHTLLYHNIYPDAAVTYDPTEHNQKVFEGVKEKGIKDIPLIFGSSVGFETIQNYPGDKYHMITSQDKIANYYLRMDGFDEIDIVLDAPSIAVVTLQLLMHLGFGPIILVGQNLAYVSTSWYAEGVPYAEQEITEERLESSEKVEDVYGNMVPTNDEFNKMRSQMELYISGVEKGRIINTTKKGAKIQGAEFKELKTVIDDNLKERIVEQQWLDGNEIQYNKEELKRRVQLMDLALEEAYRWVKEYNMNLYKMFELLANRNFKQLDIMYSRLDRSVIALESNIFFMTFILQLNRVQHKLLSDAVKISKMERNIHKKHLNLLNSYKGFIEECTWDIEATKLLYTVMNNEIIQMIEDPSN